MIHTIPEINSSGKCKPFVEIVNGTDFSLVMLNLYFLTLNNYRYGQTSQV